MQTGQAEGLLSFVPDFIRPPAPMQWLFKAACGKGRMPTAAHVGSERADAFTLAPWLSLPFRDHMVAQLSP